MALPEVRQHGEGLEIHHRKFRSQSGDDSEENLVTLCAKCHASIHLHTYGNCDLANGRRL